MAEARCEACGHDKANHKTVTDGGRRVTRCTGAPVIDRNDSNTRNLDNASMRCQCKGFNAPVERKK